MKIGVVGASGFIGKALCSHLSQSGFEILATYNSSTPPKGYSFIKFVKLDFHRPASDSINQLINCDVIINLSWNYLNDYSSINHLTEELPGQIEFLHLLISRGVRNLMVTGTCLEYGMQNGKLIPDQTTNPIINYAIAKDTLRRYLFNNFHDINIQWLRLFYVYGEGQSSKSLLPQLHQAIARGDQSFRMSKGDQIRDFIHISQVVGKMSDLIKSKDTGIYNIGTGNPTSVKEFVLNELKRINANIKLELGYYNYPDYEPMQFWAG